MKRLVLVTAITAALVLSSCSKKEDAPEGTTSKSKSVTAPAATPASEVITIESIAQFDSIINSDPNRLFLTDMYADWCKPCHMLAPTYAELSVENKENATFLKVDMEKYRELGQRYKVQGIPFVAFIKGGKTVDQVVGLAQKSDYQTRIDALK